MNQNSDIKKSKLKSWLKTFGSLLLSILLIIPLFNFLFCRAKGCWKTQRDKSSAITSLRTIPDAIETASITTTEKCPSITKLGEINLIDSKLSTGLKDRFTFQTKANGNNCEIIAISMSHPTLYYWLFDSWVHDHPTNQGPPYSYYSSSKDDWKIHYSDDENVIANENSPFYNP